MMNQMENMLWLKTDKTQAFNPNSIARMYVYRDSDGGDSLCIEMVDGRTITGIKAVEWVPRQKVIDDMLKELR